MAQSVRWVDLRVLARLIGLAAFLLVRPADATTCSAGAVVTAPTSEFTAFASRERLEMRGWMVGLLDWNWDSEWDWNWDWSLGFRQLDVRLGADTQQPGGFARQRMRWAADRPYTWVLNYDGKGNGTITVRDGLVQRVSFTYATGTQAGLRAGNALKLSVSARAYPGTATASATLSNINGMPASVSLRATGNSLLSEQSVVLAYATQPTAFTATGTVTMSHSSSPTPLWSRLNFMVTAGSVACDGGVKPAPVVSSPIPANGAVLAADALPDIGASFQDAGGGVNAATARLTVNGVDVTSSASASPTGIVYRPTTPLPEGSQSVIATVANSTGQVASLSWSFITRTPPEVPDVTPQDVATTRLRPFIRVNYADIGAGIDPALTRLSLNGADVTAQATITDSTVEFRPATDLAPGEQIVSVTAADRAGNATARTWKFRIIVLPATPPAAPGDRGTLPMPVIVFPE